MTAEPETTIENLVDNFATEEQVAEPETPRTVTKIRRKKIAKPKEKYLQKTVLFARKFSSTGAAFILATLGVITQTFHNGFLAFELSSFDNYWLRLIQATIAAFFLSGALLYFTIRSADGIESAKKLVWWFAIFEIICNLYYWAHKLIIVEWNTETGPIWSSMLIAVPFSFMLPWSIKAYASEIRLREEEDDEEFDQYEEFEVELPNIDAESMKDTLAAIVDERFSELSESTIHYGDQLDFSIATVGEGGTTVNKILKATLKKNNTAK